MKTINYILPEFAFLDGNSHEGDSLEDRTILIHNLTHTVMEVVDLSKFKMHSFRKPSFEFEYINRFAVVEKHMLVLHFSVFHDIGEIDNEQLKDISKSPLSGIVITLHGRIKILKEKISKTDTRTELYVGGLIGPFFIHFNYGGSKSLTLYLVINYQNVVINYQKDYMFASSKSRY